MINIPRDCPRGRDDCIALANLISDDGTTFNCCGENNGKNLEVKTDIYRICCKTEFIDMVSNNDKRDLTHVVSVITQSLAVIEKSYDEKNDWSPWKKSSCPK
jgi:hypothetical protein